MSITPLSNPIKQSRFILFCILLPLCGLALSLPAWGYGPAPDFTLKDLEGNPISLSQYKGKTVYIDFWATWCGPCRTSFPWMERMKQKYQGHDFRIIAISIDGKQEIIDQFLKTQGVSFKVLRDHHGQTSKAYEVKAMPSSFLVDAEGYIQYSHRGFRESDKQLLEEKIRALVLN